MIWEIGSAFKHLLLPPVLFGWLLVYGLVCFRRQPRRARWAIGLGVALLYASANSWVAGGLMTLAVDVNPARPQRAPQAVVILGGGRSLEFDAAGKVTQARLGPAAYERVFEGMRIARRTGLPILVTGGKGDGFDPAEAVVMAEVLRRDLGLAPRWIEAASRNTVENARFSDLWRCERGSETCFAKPSFRAFYRRTAPAKVARNFCDRSIPQRIL